MFTITYMYHSGRESDTHRQLARLTFQESCTGLNASDFISAPPIPSQSISRLNRYAFAILATYLGGGIWAKGHDSRNAQEPRRLG